MSNWLCATFGFLVTLALVMSVAWPTREHAGFRVGRWGQALRALAILAVGTLVSSALWWFGVRSATAEDGLLPALFAAFSFALSICFATVFMLRAQEEGPVTLPTQPIIKRSTCLLIIEESSES